VLCALLLSLAVGCDENERVTRENYEKIHEGMPMEQVEGILGKPNRHHRDDFFYKGEYGTIKIEVEKGAVEEKHWEHKK
jgi:hypothetical protein